MNHNLVQKAKQEVQKNTVTGMPEDECSNDGNADGVAFEDDPFGPNPDPRDFADFSEDMGEDDDPKQEKEMKAEVEAWLKMKVI